MRHFTLAICLLFAMSFVTLTGCAKEEGPAEQAGSAIDEAAKDAGEAMEDGMEKAGDMAEDAGDKVEDMTEDMGG